MAKVLAIVGGGAKAAAMVARAAVLRDLVGERNVPTILVFERSDIGSAWSGSGGFSSGFLTLCSPAEKDVGFPYAEVEPTFGGQSVARALFARFSWQSFLVARGGYPEWVDRGRDHPTHRLWAEYLAWVFVEAGQSIVPAEVTAVEAQPDGQWHVSCIDDDGEATYAVDGIVLTGSGDPIQVEIDPKGMPAGRILDAQSFWDHRDAVAALNEVAVAGAGGAAGTIIAWLSQRLAERSQATIYSISPMGTLFPRGDGYAERRWFSDPTDWPELAREHREKVLERTEVGVISLRNKSVIDAATNVGYVRGRAAKAAWDGSELRIEIDYEDRGSTLLKADCLISAIGFDPWSALKLVTGKPAADWLKPSARKARDDLVAEMLKNLSFPASASLGVNLHVPGLSTLAQGPGMGTLGCLGLMAKAVLDGYLD